MTPREFARAALRHLVLPVPTRSGKTLNVLLTAGPLPSAGVRCLCSLAATHVWRAAHEHECDKIVIHNGPHHKHEFDTIDLLKHLVTRRLGYWPSVMRVAGRVPSQLATRGFQALGNTFDRHRPVFRIGPMPVSGDPGRQEETHGQ